VAIVGDAIFAGSMGTGNQSWDLAKQKIREQIFSLPGGHPALPGPRSLDDGGRGESAQPIFFSRRFENGSKLHPEVLLRTSRPTPLFNRMDVTGDCNHNLNLIREASIAHALRRGTTIREANVYARETDSWRAWEATGLG